jgi:hypothetical protein
MGSGPTSPHCIALRFSGDEARDAFEGEAQDILGWAGRRQMHPDHRLHLYDAGGDLDEAQAQVVELGEAPHRARHRRVTEAHISK